MRWVVAALLFLATAINYADRLALSVISTDLRRAFSMTEGDYSQVVAVFLIAYAVMYAFSGYIVDRLSIPLNEPRPRGSGVFVFTPART
jgi:sugar phosphate permease